MLQKRRLQDAAPIGRRVFYGRGGDGVVKDLLNGVNGVVSDVRKCLSDGSFR